MVFFKTTFPVFIFNCLFLSFPALATEEGEEGLNSSYIELYLPKDWICGNYPPNHICRPKQMPAHEKAVLLISAKMGLKSDRLDNYLNRRSEFQEVKRLMINSHEWLDFLPSGHSTRNYIRRSQVAICCEEFDYSFHTTVNFYVTRGAYSKYVSLMARVINSLVFRKKNMQEIRQMLENQDPRERERLQGYIDKILSEEEKEKQALIRQQEESSFLWLWLLIPAILIPLFIYIKRRERKRKLKAFKKKKKYYKKLKR